MNGGRVMIVEDERIVALDLKQHLATLGYDVVSVVANGADALAQAVTSRPDIALMDIHLEGDLDGIATAQGLLERHGTPSVLLTAYTDDDTIGRARRGLSYGYLVKPWDARELHATIQVTLARNDADRRVRESEERFRNLTRLLSDYYWETDPEHVLVETPWRFGDKGGAGLASRYGHARWDLPHRSPDAEGWSVLRRAMDAHEPFRDFEFSLLDEAGAERFFEIAGEPMADAAGAFRGYRGVGREITDRKRVERRLTEANANIERLNAELEARILERTRSLSDALGELEGFAYTVAHDLRSPLRALSGFAGILVEDYGAGLAAEPRRLLGIVDANARRMATLIDALLEFARLGRTALKPAPVRMHDLAADVAEELRQGGRIGAHRVEIGPMPDCVGDAVLLRMVWTNLLDNAAKYASRAGEPEIAAGWDEAAGAYCVRDNGVGFDMAHAAKLFQVFARLHTEQEFPGHGAGLAIVQRIVHRHGGRAWAQSAPGRGAVFRFTIGATQPEASSAR